MKRTWTLLLLLTLACGSAVAAVPSLVATPQAPARYCARHPASMLRDLAQGTQRVVVVLKAFEPGKPGSARLVVSLLSADKTRRHEVARFAVHPLRAFSAEEPRRSQRYLVPLDGYGHLIGQDRPLCLEVAFDTKGGRTQGGRAEIEIELAGIPPAK